MRVKIREVSNLDRPDVRVMLLRRQLQQRLKQLDQARLVLLPQKEREVESLEKEVLQIETQINKEQNGPDNTVR